MLVNKTSNEELIYWQKWIHSRDPHAGDVLVKKYMPLVYYHVQRISITLPKNVNRDELISLGLLGLYDALEKFDYERELKFDTYASFRIRGAIIDGLRKEDWLSRSAREKSKKIEATVEKLEQKYLRNVTAKEIASELELPEEEVVQTMNEGFFANVLSMEEQPKDSEEGEFHSYTVRDEKGLSPEEAIIKEEVYQELETMIGDLNEKEQLVISLFYKEELTFTEIGQILGLSTSRISQIHSKAIFKLRTTLSKVM
ncbi:FliA/WhiG family RNA polymerase sigma factor [Priestia koreensis]|uniref:FliA/WhiG family RNA polymerase sigma factor n=1 Tax=Priestia koreensis TaxID=284581 RepID=UPI001F590143|nr:FliA/WhiG family RNA polymerase sigma factor [Priestia koreensis]MCM3003748.1 FliA/WhiG family RNA polymerase sigma factor [Priestia koreensis]UNL83858.1 FliA/WhiG family RNA polymerase sigma factor [Priestia koreensis]